MQSLTQGREMGPTDGAGGGLVTSMWAGYKIRPNRNCGDVFPNSTSA